ncbi:hypothetical protein Pla52n_45180 [Stieleria varia]|uniref:Uncharacterized protein n=1 Tax=Stieleria varia TaxID=2528005 RepID=A0A5C6APZ5_9BACT|nr:hypothetical protein Pla52n_45180 [Stieleria varia]
MPLATDPKTTVFQDNHLWLAGVGSRSTDSASTDSAQYKLYRR